MTNLRSIPFGYSTVSPEEDGELFDVFEDSEDEEDNSEMDLPENDDYEE